MNIEVIEFYPTEYREDKGILTGTLRIKLPDIGIHILGIYVSKRKNSWFFTMPGRNGVHHETGESIRFPFLVFEDREKQKELLVAIREKGKAFIENKLDAESPFSVMKGNQQPKIPKACDNVTETKQATSIVKKSERTIAMKEWIDPPKRRMTKNG